MKRIALACVMVLLMGGVLRADTLSNENDARDLVKKIMARALVGDLLGTFATIKPYMPISGSDFDKMALQYKSVIDQYLTKYGNPTDTEIVDEKKVGDNLLRIRALERNEKYAHTWTFYFLKNKQGWTINSFNWDDSFKGLFDR